MGLHRASLRRHPISPILRSGHPPRGEWCPSVTAHWRPVIEEARAMASTDAATAIPITGGEIFGVRTGLDPHRPGLHRVRLIDHGRPLWVIIAYLQSVNWDVEDAADAYDLPIEAVLAA